LAGCILATREFRGGLLRRAGTTLHRGLGWLIRLASTKERLARCSGSRERQGNPGLVWGMFLHLTRGSDGLQRNRRRSVRELYWAERTAVCVTVHPARFGRPRCPNPFPVAPAPKHFSIQNPGTALRMTHWRVSSRFRKRIGSSPAFNNRNRAAYAENYELSVQRQLTSSDLLTVSYVGTARPHRLLSRRSANPGIPSLGLALAAAGCGPGGENNIYTLGGVTTAGTRGPFSAPYRNTPVPGAGFIVPFGNDSLLHYDRQFGVPLGAGQTGGTRPGTCRFCWGTRSASRLTILPAMASRSTRTIRGSAGDFLRSTATHNFVISYNYRLPFDKIETAKALTHGWKSAE